MDIPHSDWSPLKHSRTTLWRFLFSSQLCWQLCDQSHPLTIRLRFQFTQPLLQQKVLSFLLASSIRANTPSVPLDSRGLSSTPEQEIHSSYRTSKTFLCAFGGLVVDFFSANPFLHGLHSVHYLNRRNRRYLYSYSDCKAPDFIALAVSVSQQLNFPIAQQNWSLMGDSPIALVHIPSQSPGITPRKDNCRNRYAGLGDSKLSV